MYIYIFTIVFTCLLCYIAEELDWYKTGNCECLGVVHSPDTRIVYFLVVCILIFVAGLRYKVGDDYMGYYKGYSISTDELLKSIKSLDEPGYDIIAWVITRFIDDPAAVIFTSSLVTISLPLIVTYKYSKGLLLPTFLYITMGCWTGSFNGIRQYLATSILVCGYKSLREKKFLKYCLFVFGAFLFHRSAIVFLFLYFVVNREISIPNIIFLLAAAGLLLFSYDRVFHFANYVMKKNYSLENVYTATSVNRLRILAACVPSVLFLIGYHGEEKKASTTFALNIIILRTALSVLAMNSALLYRITSYLSIFSPMAISELIKGLSKRNKNIITVGLVAMYLIMWWYELSNSSSLKPFQWIWNR